MEPWDSRPPRNPLRLPAVILSRTSSVRERKDFSFRMSSRNRCFHFHRLVSLVDLLRLFVFVCFLPLSFFFFFLFFAHDRGLRSGLLLSVYLAEQSNRRDLSSDVVQSDGRKKNSGAGVFIIIKIFQRKRTKNLEFGISSEVKHPSPPTRSGVHLDHMGRRSVLQTNS